MPNPTGEAKFSGLRQRAETIVAEQALDVSDVSPAAMQQLIHELKVHQIELELQNEELRQVQFERELAQKNYTDLYDFAPVGYLTLDEDGLIVEINLTGAEMLGRDKTALMSQRLSHFVVPEDQDAYHFYYRQLAKTDTVQRREIRLVKKDGTHFYARLEGQRAESRQYRLIISDISERVQAEQARQEAHNFMSAVLDAAGALIIVVDRAGCIVRFNRACEQLSHYRFDEVQGQPIWGLLLPPEERAPVKTVFEQLRAGQFPNAFENHWLARDGSRHLISWSNTVLHDSEGVVQYVIGIGIDITQRRAAEIALTQLLETVSQQREQLRAVTGRLAEVQESERKALARELHDQVGQKLTALNLNLNLIVARLPQTLTATEPLLKVLGQSLKLVEETTEQIRDVMAHLRPPVLDDYGLVAALRWYGTDLSKRVGFAIIIEGEEPEPRLAASVEHALFRIAQEALTNVSKHARAGRVTVTVATDQETVHLVVADDGRGFEQADEPPPGERQHWGLLTMIERAEIVGGQCRITSQPGQGTQVIVEVPR